jgi:hypothetical protein
MSTISEIKEKLKDLTLELNSVCYNSNLIPQLQTVWDKLNLLEESIEKFDSWKDAKEELPIINKESKFSDRVFAKVKGHKKIAVMRLVEIVDNDTILYKWSNCYGNLYGESYLDNDYIVTEWKYIQL